MDQDRGKVVDLKIPVFFVEYIYGVEFPRKGRHIAKRHSKRETV
jgi:hypothetical protein